MTDEEARRVQAEEWDARYAGSDLVWGAEPNRWVVEVCAGLTAGRALDLACGEGRNTLWLARQGWQVTGVDFSPVALERAGYLAGSDPSPAHLIRWVQADLLGYQPPPAAFELVLLAYLHLPAQQRTPVVRAAAQALAPGGTLLVVAHDSTNLADGTGGPQDPHVLYTAADVTHDLVDMPGVQVTRAERVHREVNTATGPRRALDLLVTAHHA
jgi:SAM-dependent methyltransferase